MNKNERKEFAKIAAAFGEPPTKGPIRRLTIALKEATALGRKEMGSCPHPIDLNRFLLPSEH
jgi:hypothetical protein